MGGTNTIQAVNHAIDIIEYLYKQGGEISISEIAKGTGMFGSTIHRQLTTLKERGFIYQNPDNLKYCLGFRMYTIGNVVKNNLPFMNSLSACAEQVALKYHQTAFVAVPDYSSDICAQQLIIFRKSYSDVVFEKEIVAGTLLQSHGSATGKCMMAYYPERLIEQYRMSPLEKMTEKTIIDWELLQVELGRIRTRGYAMDSDEEEEGKTCLAVPVLDEAGNIAASISLSGQTKSIFEIPINAIIRDLNEAAEQFKGKKA